MISFHTEARLWFTADYHLWHENIIDLCSRPFNKLSHMHNALIKNHNDLVDSEDIVYIIGDLYWGRGSYNLINILSKLNGRKRLILGNHDLLNPFEYEEYGIEHVSTWLNVGDLYLVHDPAKAALFGKGPVLCGHVHNLFKRINNVLNVGVDVWDFKPVSIDQVLNVFKK